MLYNSAKLHYGLNTGLQREKGLGNEGRGVHFMPTTITINIK